MIASTVSALLALSTAAFAARSSPSNGASACDVSRRILPLPANQTHLVIPTTDKPSIVGLAFGYQNYTCNAATSTYTSTGAVAQLYDISCLVGTDRYDTVTVAADKAWQSASAPHSVTPANIASDSCKIVAGIHEAGNPSPLGQHYFVTNPITGTGINPKWDFLESHRNDITAFVVGAKKDGLSAPTGTADVDWLSLTSIQGDLANEIFRVDTRGGQPLASCVPGTADIMRKYTAKYWLYGTPIKTPVKYTHSFIKSRQD